MTPNTLSANDISTGHARGRLASPVETLTAKALRIRRDIISGGEGTDTLDGGLGEDILLGGRYDQEHVKAAMDTIMATWRETTSYTTRVSKLRDVGVGPTKQYRLSIQTVLDDEKTDNMIGASDLDWFFAQSNAAFLGFENPGRTSGETLTSIKPKKQ